jgi:hypothetical protein
MNAEERKPFFELHKIDQERYSEQQKELRETGKFTERNDDFILNRATMNSFSFCLKDHEVAEPKEEESVK